MDEYARMAQQVIESLRPVRVVGGAVAVSAAGSAVWDWLRARLSPRGAGKALQAVEENPDKERAWQMLQLEVAELLEESPDLWPELQRMLPAAGESVASQTATVVGDGSVVTQVAGQGNVVVAPQTARGQDPAA